MPGWAVVAILLYSASAAADSSSDAAKRAVALFEEGRALAAQGKDAEACDRFLQSFELEPALGTELNLADCLQRQGYLRRAWGYYDHVARVAKREGDVLRAKFARERAEAIVPQLATVVINLADPEVAVTVNERDIAGEGVTRRELVDPGEIEVAASAPGRKKFSTKLTVIKGKTAEVSVPALAATKMIVGAAPSTRRKRSWVYASAAIAGLAVVDLGFAAVATNTVLVRQDEFEEYNCGLALGYEGDIGDDCRRRLHALHQWQGRAIWSTLLGVGLAGTATFIYLMAPNERLTVAPVAGTKQIGLALSGSF
jgi:hypothetical protein